MKKFLKISSTVHAAVLLCVIIVPAIFHPRYKHRVLTVQLVGPLEFNMPKIQPQAEKTEKAKTKEPPIPKPVKKKETPVAIKKNQQVIPVRKAEDKPLPLPTLSSRLAKKLESANYEEPGKLLPHPSSSSISATKAKATVSSTSDFAFQWYLDFIQGKISSLWHQPQMSLAKEYNSVVSFTILKDGQVRNIETKRSSGIDIFDKSTLDAIYLLQPLPQLPPGYKHPQLVVNVEFRIE